MNKLLVAAALGMSLTMTGCVISVGHDGVEGSRADWADREHDNRKKINKLSPQMSYRDVSDLMGVPDFNEFYEIDDNKFQVLYFRTQRKEGDGVTTKDECTPLVIKNGNLVGWGDSAYAILRN